MHARQYGIGPWERVKHSVISSHDPSRTHTHATHTNARNSFSSAQRASGVRKIVQRCRGQRIRCRASRFFRQRKGKSLTWHVARQVSSFRRQSNTRKYAIRRITPLVQAGQWLLGSCYSATIHMTHHTSAVASQALWLMQSPSIFTDTCDQLYGAATRALSAEYHVHTFGEVSRPTPPWFGTLSHRNASNHL